MRSPPRLILLVSLVWAAPILAGEPGLDEIQRCTEKNFPRRSARQEAALETIDRAGGRRTLQAEILWKRSPDDLSRVLIRVEAPPDERGSAFLLLERRDGPNDMFTYLPEFKTVRRLNDRSVSGSLFGTDFSYEDLAHLQSIASHGKHERLPDAEIGGRPTYVVAATPAPDSGSAYQRVVSYIDKQTCVTLDTKLYGKPDRVAKELAVAPEQVKQVNGRWLPYELSMRDLEKGRVTKLVVKKVQFDVDLSDRVFSETELTKGH